MKRAIDEVIDIHKEAEIRRLQDDINKKCRQIAELLGGGITWTNNLFYRKVDNKRVRVL